MKKMETTTNEFELKKAKRIRTIKIDNRASDIVKVAVVLDKSSNMKVQVMKDEDEAGDSVDDS